MKNILITLLGLLACTWLSAQNAITVGKWRFNSVNQVGLLQGENHSAANIQSVNGFRRNHFFGGLGTGLDYYQYRTIPLFTEARWYFGSSINQFFIYGDAGANFVWQEKTATLYGTNESYHPGFYGGAGIGYKAGLKNGMAITLSAGYTYKKVVTVQQEIRSCPFVGPCQFYPETYRYSFNRLIFQLGWLF